MDPQWDIKEQRLNAFLDYCAIIAETAEQPISPNQLIKDFPKQDFKGHFFANHFRKHIVPRITNSDYSLEIQARLYFMLSIPFDKNNEERNVFLNKLEQKGNVELDSQRRISKYVSHDKTIKFEGQHRKLRKTESNNRETVDDDFSEIGDVRIYPKPEQLDPHDVSIEGNPVSSVPSNLLRSCVKRESIEIDGNPSGMKKIRIERQDTASTSEAWNGNEDVEVVGIKQEDHRSPMVYLNPVEFKANLQRDIGLEEVKPRVLIHQESRGIENPICSSSETQITASRHIIKTEPTEIEFRAPVQESAQSSGNEEDTNASSSTPTNFSIENPLRIKQENGVPKILLNSLESSKIKKNEEHGSSSSTSHTVLNSQIRNVEPKPKRRETSNSPSRPTTENSAAKSSSKDSTPNCYFEFFGGFDAFLVRLRIPELYDLSERVRQLCAKEDDGDMKLYPSTIKSSFDVYTRRILRQKDLHASYSLREILQQLKHFVRRNIGEILRCELSDLVEVLLENVKDEDTISAKDLRTVLEEFVTELEASSTDGF